MGGTANTPDPFGTNGFKFKFQQSNALGDDTSGKGNDFTSSGLTTNNQTTDSPTQNHCTWDRNDSANLAAFSEGNLKVTGGSASTSGSCRGTLAPKSGKFYFEVKFLGGAFSGHNSLGIRNKNVVINSTTSGVGATPKSYHWRDDGYVIDGDISTGSMTSGFSTYTTNDYIGVAMDLDNGKLFMSKNGTYEKSGNPVTGANPMFTIPTGQPYAPWWLGYGYTNNNELNCGQRAFNTDPPTGYLALHQGNLPETSKGVTGFTWIKDRDNALNHNSYDSSNGVFNRLVPNATSTILNTQGGVSKFLKGGIVVGDTSNVNNDGGSMVSWNWVANSGTTATNNDGSLTSTVQVNQTAGFSIVQGKYFDGTLGHGLSQTPEWILYKETSPNTNNWFVWHKDLTSTNYYLYLNSSQAQANYGSTLWAPTSTTFATNLATLSNRDAVAYLWHGVDGFSKFGKYTGNGSTDGPFVYTGFKPAWIMVKRINTTGSWAITDIARDPFNPTDKGLVPDSSGAEGTGYTLDHLSNGFKLRLSGTAYNASGSTYIYMAFAEHPFVGDGTNPVTAR